MKIESFTGLLLYAASFFSFGVVLDTLCTEVNIVKHSEAWQKGYTKGYSQSSIDEFFLDNTIKKEFESSVREHLGDFVFENYLAKKD